MRNFQTGRSHDSRNGTKMIFLVLRPFSRLSGVTDEDEMEDIVGAYLRNWAKSFRLWKVDAHTLECLKQTRDWWVYEFKYGKTIDAA